MYMEFPDSLMRARSLTVKNCKAVESKKHRQLDRSFRSKDTPFTIFNTPSLGVPLIKGRLGRCAVRVQSADMHSARRRRNVPC